jgi:dienelactone hydrolase
MTSFASVSDQPRSLRNLSYFAAALIAGNFLSISPSASAAEDLTVLSTPPGDTAPSEMMDQYLIDLATAALDRRETELEKLKTPEQLAAYQDRLKRQFIEHLGGLPDRTPLNAHVTGQESRDGYHIEKVIFESQPRHYVTGVVYLPSTPPPYPGVIVPCGHSANGKAAEPYQRACILLAKNGLAAFCYDPIGQGERLQILPAEGQPPYNSTLEHTLVGVNSIPLGTSTARYHIWDGMRALDYLASRPDIDPKRLGCTGNSGGGTQTSYLMALDDRIVCAAPSCYLTSMRRLLATLGPQDAEQNIHAQIAFGMDLADYVLMRAPRPTLICVATRDYFDIGGAWHCFRQAKRFYTRLNHSERVELVETDATHGFSIQLREAMVRWMRRWLLHVDDAITETDFPISKDEQLQCSPQGQVMKIPGARSVFDLNREWEARLVADRKTLWQGAERSQGLAWVRRMSGVRPLAELPEPETELIDEISRKGYRIQKMVLRTEPGITLPALAFIPQHITNGPYLYLHEAGKDADAAVGGPIEKLTLEGRIVLAVDLRASGESRTRKSMKQWDELISPDWKNYFLAYMLDKSYVGMRTEDVLVCAQFLKGYKNDGEPRRVHLVGVGDAGIPVLHALALEPQLFSASTVRRSLNSWASVVQTPLSKNQLLNVVHGALTVYDLPDLAATLPTDKLKIEEPVDAKGEATNSNHAKPVVQKP